MRDLGERMAELKFEAPLAKFEEQEDEWGGCEFISSTPASDSCALNDNINLNSKDAQKFLEETLHEITNSTGGAEGVSAEDDLASPNCNSIHPQTQSDVFMETFGGSLEDLVNTFDEKITKCFGNYEQNMEDLAPVVVRSQEEIMSECQ